VLCCVVLCCVVLCCVVLCCVVLCLWLNWSICVCPLVSCCVVFIELEYLSLVGVFCSARVAAQVSIIERAMRDAHIAVKPTKNAKQQVRECGPA
jgi:hypothetical protein